MCGIFGRNLTGRFMIEQYCYVTPLTAFVEGILQWQEKQQQIHMDFWVATRPQLRITILGHCGGVIGLK
jgi:hypothetical protein